MKRALILAGGLGKRMYSPRPKVVHEILGKPIVKWVIDAARRAGINDIGVVVGHGGKAVKNALDEDVKIYFQSKQLGTADAVKTAMEFLDGRIVVLYGDAPLVKPSTIKRLLEDEADMTVLTADVKKPDGYGRIVRKAGEISKIVEDIDATTEELKIHEINSGMYAFNADALKFALKRITPNNQKGEYYLTDAVDILLKEGKRVDAVKIENESEILGANTQEELSLLFKIAREEILVSLMDAGVTIEDPVSTFVGPDVHIEQGVVLKPFTFVYGNSFIAPEAIIGPETTLIDTIVGEKSLVYRSECNGAKIGRGCSVGPFSRLRPGTVLEDGVKVGNYVEVKNSHLFESVKAQHLTYLGDATVGAETNVGAGTITCNYDGIKKNKTTIGKRVFIGSNSALVAPVKIGDNAMVGAGSIITDNVPAYALALGRARQINKEGWVLKKMEASDEK